MCVLRKLTEVLYQTLSGIFRSLLLFTIFLLSTAFADEINYRNELPLDSVQFKATHNSYQLPDLPKVQIDDYNVWEIELDFGYIKRYGGFVVGHDRPEPKQSFFYLRDWIENVLSAESLTEHPLIIKLEAKTANPGRVSHSSIRFDPGRFWPENWAGLLVDSLRLWIGSERIIDPKVLVEDFSARWPSVESMAGRVIISLQDNSDNFFVSGIKTQLFIDSIPGLTVWWPPVKDSLAFKKAIESGANRITLDEGYRELWVKQLK